MSEEAQALLQDLQTYFAQLQHLKVEGAPALELVAQGQSPPKRGPSQAPASQRRPTRGQRGRALPKEARPRPSFAMGSPEEAGTKAPGPSTGRGTGPRQSKGPTWGPGARSASLPARQNPAEVLKGLQTHTQLPRGEAHLVAHGGPSPLVVVEAIALEGERRSRKDPYDGRIGQMLGQLLKRVMGVTPQQVCLIQALTEPSPEAIDGARAQLEALVQGAQATRVLGFGAYCEALLLPKGGKKGEGQGRFGRVGGAQVLITHGLEEMNATPALKRPAYQDLLEFQRRLERGR